MPNNHSYYHQHHKHQNHDHAHNDSHLGCDNHHDHHHDHHHDSHLGCVSNWWWVMQHIPQDIALTCDVTHKGNPKHKEERQNTEI